MLKNTLKGVLALAAIGCLAAPATQASAQMPFGTPVYSTRLGGSLVAGMNVGYFNNGINSLAGFNPVLNWRMNATTHMAAMATSAYRTGNNGNVGIFSAPVSQNRSLGAPGSSTTYPPYFTTLPGYDPSLPGGVNIFAPGVFQKRALGAAGTTTGITYPPYFQALPGYNPALPGGVSIFAPGVFHKR